MKRYFGLIILAATLALASCQKDFSEPSDLTPTNNNELNVSSSFDWKTTHEVVFNLTGFANSIVEICSEEGTVYLRAGLEEGQNFNTKISLPTYQENVVLKFLGQSIIKDATGNQISHTFTINGK
jgi:hypothetical protein